MHGTRSGVLPNAAPELTAEQQAKAAFTASWTAAGWLASLGATTELARALLGPDAGSDELTATRALASLSEEELAERLEAARLGTLFARVLRPRLERLAQSRAATGFELHSKYVQDGSFDFEMVYGDLSTFFGGLEAKIGPPDPLVFDAMQREHMEAADSVEPFTTFNYGVTTTPRTEWCFVVEPELCEEWPVEAKLVDTPKMQRKPMSSRDLDAALARVNAKLKALCEALLLREESIGARLYTGPMCELCRPLSST